MRQWIVAMIIAVAQNGTSIQTTNPPTATITNGDLHAQVYLPDAKSGFYRGTRFDWSGVVRSLQYKGHDFFGPWFDRWDPTVHDFIYSGNEIVAGICSATMGPVEEFRVIGFDQAKPHETFLKIGIGTLRKPDEGPYDNYRTYEIVDPGTWTIEKGSDWISFTQKLEHANGYGYLYSKTLRFVAGQPRMVIEHSLKNTGRLPIETDVYDHNFLVMDRKGPQKKTTLTFPFTVKGSALPSDLAEIKGKQIIYRKTLEGKEVVATPIQGFSNSPADYDLHVESPAAGIGVQITGDRPIAKMGLWSIRSVVSIEPFIDVSIKPQAEMTWNLTYDFYEVKPSTP